MIIRHPTSLYAQQLPQGTAAGNITWTISTQEPKLSTARFLRLPVAEEIRKRPLPVFTEAQRRLIAEGDLVYTLLESDQTTTGSNKQQFSLGEVIEFNAADTTVALSPDPTPDVVDIQHNVSLLDLESIGLSKDDIDTLTVQSQAKKREFEDQLTAVKAAVANTQVEIVENQKKVNETNKVIAATRQIYGIVDGDLANPNPLYQKLLASLVVYRNNSTTLNAQYNNLITQSQNIYNSLLQLSELVH